MLMLYLGDLKSIPPIAGIHAALYRLNHLQKWSKIKLYYYKGILLNLFPKNAVLFLD